jgi:uncharacterized protein
MSKTKKTTPAHIIWFEIPTDKPERAKVLYGRLFGWNIRPLPGMPDYQQIETQQIDTGGADAAPDGGLRQRMHPGHTISNYIVVPAVTRFMTKVEKLGGRICGPKMAVPGRGDFAICPDTENDTFALWDANPKAK